MDVQVSVVALVVDVIRDSGSWRTVTWWQFAQ